MARLSTVTASVALYLAARQLSTGTCPRFRKGAGTSTPSSWQLLFVLGAWFALERRRAMCPADPFPCRSLPALRDIAHCFISLFALVITSTRRPARTGANHSDSVLTAFLPRRAGKTLAPLPGAASAVDGVPRSPRLAPGMLARVSLAKFCQPARQIRRGVAGGASAQACFLSFAAHFVLITGPNSLAMQVLVSVAGIFAMTGGSVCVVVKAAGLTNSAAGAHP